MRTPPVGNSWRSFRAPSAGSTSRTLPSTRNQAALWCRSAFSTKTPLLSRHRPGSFAACFAGPVTGTRPGGAGFFSSAELSILRSWRAPSQRTGLATSLRSTTTRRTRQSTSTATGRGTWCRRTSSASTWSSRRRLSMSAGVWSTLGWEISYWAGMASAFRRLRLVGAGSVPVWVPGRVLSLVNGGFPAVTGHVNGFTVLGGIWGDPPREEWVSSRRTPHACSPPASASRPWRTFDERARYSRARVGDLLHLLRRAADADDADDRAADRDAVAARDRQPTGRSVFRRLVRVLPACQPHRRSRHDRALRLRPPPACRSGCRCRPPACTIT